MLAFTLRGCYHVSSRFFKRGFNSLTGFDSSLKINKEANTASITQLDNGVRVVTYHMNYPTCTVGLYINAGSRFESEKTNGTAHFLEHMAFKGSSKYSQIDMEKLVEQIGTRLFAYTSREHTAFYGKCFSKDGGKVVEILSDIIQNPVLDQSAIEREKGVILREMEEVETQPEEVVFDYLHGTAYQGSTLGYTILGPSENIKSMTRNNLYDYISTHYTGPRTVLVAVGDVDHNEYVDYAKQYLGNLKSKFLDDESSQKPAIYVGSDVKIQLDDMPHAHVAVGFEGCSHNHPDFMPLMIASLHLGSYNQSMTLGKCHTSGLAQRVVKDDLAYSFSSYNACYSDTGLWGVYFVSHGHKLHDMLIAIGREMTHLRNETSDFDALVAKNLFKSSYLMHLDGTTPVFEEIGRQILSHNRFYSPSQICNMVDSVTAEQIREAVSHMMTKSEHALAAMGPISQIAEYNVVKAYFFNPFI